MKLTVKDLEGKTMGELGDIAYNLLDSRSEINNDDNIYRKFTNTYCIEVTSKNNGYVRNYNEIMKKKDVTEEDEKAEKECIEGRRKVLAEVIKNIERYDNLANYIKKLKSKISKYEKYKIVDAEDINNEISEFEKKRIHPDQIDEIKGKLKDLEEKLDKEFGEINYFANLERIVGYKLKDLKNKKFLIKKEYDKYKERIGNVSKIFYSSVYKNDLKADASENEMMEFNKELLDLSEKSGEFKSLKTLSEEELGENETKPGKVKNYIKTKIGNARYFETKITDYSESYNGANDVMSLEEMRRIYGSKGALMMICHLEDGSISGTKKKRFSNYRKFCNKILENYRALKVEAAITVLEGGNVGNFVNEDKDKDRNTEKLNSLLCELNELKGWDTSKFQLADTGNKKFSFSKFFSSTKSQIAKLKSTNGEKNSERKKLIDQVVKEIRKIEGDSFVDVSNVEMSLQKQEYIKKYNDFVEKSADLAVTYLKKEGEKKIARFKKVWDTKRENREYCTIDICKVALMCLVAVCSKKDKSRTAGETYFSKVKKYLKDTIG